MRQVIYETKGRAREFNELAINLFTGCEHGCIYCYGADVLHKSKEEYSQVLPRITVYDILKSAKEWADKGETRRILLCFVTDPYTPSEEKTMITRKTIMALHEVGLNVIILTKGGERSIRDFDLLTDKDAYATTLTCLDETESRKWEPNAALPYERIKALREAHNRGIETWVSFEPVINPLETIALLTMTHPFVGHYKVGTMNYHHHGKTIDWRNFGLQIKEIMDNLGVKYYFKKDLLKHMGHTPETFNQTWVCR